MLVIIILGLIILLIISAFLSKKKTITDKSKITSKTKKILAIIVSVLFILLIIDTLTSDGVRSFYCLSGNKCVTVWKRGNGVVYVIPGKYQSNDEPSVSHIKTISEQFLTLYFSNEKELSYKIIVRDQGNYRSNKKQYTLVYNAKSDWQFLEYSDNYKSILYKPDAVKFKDVKESTEYIDLDIQENYATDKSGKKLK